MKIPKKELFTKKHNETLKNLSSTSEHNILLGKDEFEYKLRISKRARNIQLQINQEGILHLVLPNRIKEFDHISFLMSKSDWIQKHLRLKPHNHYLLFGESIIVKSNYHLFEKKIKCSLDSRVLSVSIPSNESSSVKIIYESWLFQKAMDYLPLRINELAEANSFKPGKISIRRQRTRWGSCSKSGSIALNYKLMMLRKELIDYVIIHELCHLIELNHSKKFWNLVKKILPGFAQLRQELRQIRI